MNRLIPLHRTGHSRSWRSLLLLSFICLCSYAAQASCALTAVWTYTVHGDTVYFVSSDTNTAAHHFWSFGDGSTGASGISATHVYPNYGSYHVCFDDYIPNTSCTDSFCQTITLTAVNPCANLTAAWTFANHSGDTVHFYAVDTSSAAHCYWTFGDGGAVTAGNNPIHTYATAGHYTVCLHIYIPGTSCADSFCSTISVGTPCATSAAWTSYSHGDTVFFTAADTNSTVHLDWNAGDGNYIFGINPSHVYAQAGTYHVCLYAYIPSTACEDSFCTDITVGTGCHLSALWSYTTSGDTVRLTGVDTTSAAHHIWTFSDGTYATGYDAVHVFSSPGTYHICYYVYLPNTGCSDSSCNSVTITSHCTVSAAWQYYTIDDSAHFYATDTSTAVQYVWHFGDGTTGSGRLPWHGYSQPGTYTVCLYAYANNCTDTFCNTVTIGTGCNISAAWTYTSSGDSVHFISADTNTRAHYYWSFGDGGTASGISPAHTYTSPGTYHVCQYMYIPNTNCSDSSCNTIVVTSGCNITAAWQSYVIGDTVHFYAAESDSAVHLIWSYGDGSTDGSGRYLTHTYALPGTYHVCLYAYLPGTACSDSFCNTVTAGGGCNLSAAWTYTAHGDSAFFTSADTSTVPHHYWSFGDGTGGTGVNVTHVYAQAGTYHVCQYVYIIGGTCTDSSCNTIIIASTACSTTASWGYYTVRDSAHFYAADTSSQVHLSWSFGDGTTGTGTYPWHRYAQAGTYHVCLYASVPGTICADTFCNTVVIGPGCALTATWSYTVSGDSIYLTGVDTTSAAHHIWNFGDGSYTTGYTATHLFSGPGTYHICYYVYIPNTTCSDSSCNTVVIDSSCHVNAAWTSYTIAGDSAHFYAYDTSTAVHFAWNFGDGGTSSLRAPWHHYLQSGTYHVCLYAYTSTACIDSFCSNVTIGTGCTINATWSYTLHGDTLVLTTADTTGAARHNWNFGDGTSGAGTSLSHVYAAAGSYHVCLYVYIPGTVCSDSSCNNILIIDSCITDAAWTSTVHGDTVYFYATDTGSTVHYDWNAGDGNYIFGTRPYHVYTQSGTYHICLYAYIPGTSCIDSFCNTVTIGTGCNISAAWTYAGYSDSVRFTGSGTNTAAHYYWSFGDGTSGSGYDVSHTYTAPGTYHVCHYVYLPNTNCYDSTCNDITIAGPCTLTAAWNYILSGDTFHFYALIPDSNVYILWAFGDGTIASGPYVIHSYLSPGTYQVCVHAYIPGTSCTDSMCLAVTVGDSCAVTAAWTSITRAGDSIQFYAADPDTGAHHIWSFGDGATASGSYAAHTFATAGIYHVCLYVYIPGTTCSDSLCQDVNSALGIAGISSYPSITLAPNPFSQYAVLNIDGPASAYEVHIYDMVGQLVRTDRGNNNAITISRGSLTSGIYIYEVVANNMIIGKGKMSIE